MRFNFCLLGLFLVTRIAFFSWVSLGEFVCVCLCYKLLPVLMKLCVLCGMIVCPETQA